MGFRQTAEQVHGQCDHLTSSYTAEELRQRWLREAARHESAADEHCLMNEDDVDREERLLHLECARVLRNCAKELKWAE